MRLPLARIPLPPEALGELPREVLPEVPPEAPRYVEIEVALEALEVENEDDVDAIAEKKCRRR